MTTILLILGIVNSKEEKLANRIAEVGTGEGKSIILAITALYLAIVGFDVKIACYSLYLSERDQESFRDIFEFLNISDKISYGTFNSIC